MSDTELIDQSFDIAWRVLLQSGDLGAPEASAKFLFREIVNIMMKKGERRRLVLSNAAIDAYRLRFGALTLVD